MSETLTIKVKDELARYINKFSVKYNKPIHEVANELLIIGLEQKFSTLYKRYQAGEMSLGWLGQEFGLSIRDIYELLEKRNLPLSAGAAMTLL